MEVFHIGTELIRNSPRCISRFGTVFLNQSLRKGSDEDDTSNDFFLQPKYWCAILLITCHIPSSKFDQIPYPLDEISIKGYPIDEYLRNFFLTSLECSGL
jgi:hypothetical protein